MKNNREGLTVLIIGASSGIGKGVARRLAEDRANVVIGARRTGLIEALAEEWKKAGTFQQICVNA